MMKEKFPFVAVFAASLFLAAPIAHSDTAQGTHQQTPCSTLTLTTACGSTVKDNCRGRCYFEYEKFICGNPKPGQVSQHKKELKECNQSCKPSKCG